MTDPKQEFRDALEAMFNELGHWSRARCEDSDEFCDMIESFNREADAWMDDLLKRRLEHHPEFDATERKELDLFVRRHKRWPKA